MPKKMREEKMNYSYNWEFFLWGIILAIFVLYYDYKEKERKEKKAFTINILFKENFTIIYSIFVSMLLSNLFIFLKTLIWREKSKTISIWYLLKVDIVITIAIFILYKIITYLLKTTKE